MRITLLPSASVSRGTAEYECSYLVHTVGRHQQLYTARPLLLAGRIRNERCTGT